MPNGRVVNEYRLQRPDGLRVRLRELDNGVFILDCGRYSDPLAFQSRLALALALVAEWIVRILEKGEKNGGHNQE